METITLAFLWSLARAETHHCGQAGGKLPAWPDLLCAFPVAEGGCAAPIQTQYVFPQEREVL